MKKMDKETKFLSYAVNIEKDKKNQADLEDGGS